MTVHKRPSLHPSLCQLNPVCAPYRSLKILSSIISPCDILPLEKSSHKYISEKVFCISRVTPAILCTRTFPVVTLTKGVTQTLWRNNRRTVKTCVFWHVIRCTVVDNYRRSGGICWPFISWHVVVYETSVINITKRLECGHVQFSRKFVTTGNNLKSAFSRCRCCL